MHKGLSLLILAAFALISTAGLLAFHHDNGGYVTSCLASAVGGNAPCPESNPLGFARFHLDAFKMLSLSIIDGGMTIVISALSALLLVLFSFSPAVFALEHQPVTYRLGFERLPVRAQRAFHSWFALHENSPAVF